MKKFNTQLPKQWFTTWLLLGLTVLVVGCSTIRFTYNHGDTLLYWWLNAYIDVDSDQKPWIKQEIEELFTWHRATQLHDYAALLRTAQHQLAGRPTQQDLLADFNTIRSETRELLTKSLPELTDLARAMKPDQIAQMEKKFEKNNADYRKKFMSGDFDHRKKVRYEKAMEQFNLWFGNFSSEQEAQIRRLSDARPMDNDIWLDERMRRQRRILEVVRKIQSEKLDKTAASAQIAGLIKENFDRFDAPERKAFFDHYLDTTTRFILGVIELTTPAQRAFAQQRMQGWIDDFNSLAVQKQ